MSVRRRRWRDPTSGALRKKWMVDIVYTHPDGRQCRVRKVSPTQTRRAAERYERELRHALLSGKYEQKEVPTLREFAEEVYLPQCRVKNKPSTANSKESALRVHWYPRFGDVTLDAIDESDIEDACFEIASPDENMPKGRMPKTVNNLVGVLNNILSVAERRKVIAAAPDVNWLAVTDGGFDFFDFDEAERLIAGAERDEDWACAIVMALKTGMRLGELRALRWADVDLVKGVVTVRRNLWRQYEGTTKTGRSRVIPLAPSARSLLKEHRHLRGERVFLGPPGTDFSVGTWRHALYRACRRAGLRKAGWHMLRHTFASHLVMRNRTLTEVQQLLGHTRITMTTRYAHLAPGMKQDAVRTLDDEAPSWFRAGTIAAQENN